MKSSFAIAFITIFLSGWAVSHANAADQRYVTIGTGGVTGVYYPTGGAICRSVNRGRNAHGVRCSVVSTTGSAGNIEGLRDGTFVLGVAQSDVQISAIRGEKEFAVSGPFPDLRALFSVHSELIQIVARTDSGIKTFDDLKGKRVNIGNVGSGQRATTELIMAHHGWTSKTFSKAGELRSAEQSKALCDGNWDAFSFTAGVPNASVKEAMATCDASLVPLGEDWVDAFIAQNPAYAKDVIVGGTYRGNVQDTPVFGLKAVVLTTAQTPDEIVYEIVKAVFKRIDVFRKLHPAFADLKIETMVKDGIAAPLHPGALRYYREVGLLP